jgi:hypothetical protein
MQMRNAEEEDEVEDELESAFLALLLYGSTYVLSTLSGRRLTILGGQVPEDVGW